MKHGRRPYRPNKFSGKGILVIAGSVLLIAALVTTIVFTDIFSFGKKNPRELFEQYKKSVVLIRHSYIYKMNLAGQTYYFKDFSESGGIDEFYMEDEIAENIITSYGTGFFISKDGKIATNRHVVTKLTNEIKEKLISRIKQDASVSKISLENEKLEIEKNIRTYDDYLSENAALLEEYAVQKIKQERQSYINEKEQITAKISLFDILLTTDKSNANIDIMTIKLGIALDGTHVTDEDDYIDCISLAVSEEEEIDVAIIQTKSQKIPDDVTDFIDITEQDENELPEINQKIYLIGYNYGKRIGTTKSGLKVQLTQGTVSQETDGKKILYSIPTLPGSSGSPVIDEKGNLIAINFAGYGETQNFNYGIITKHLIDLYNK